MDRPNGEQIISLIATFAALVVAVFVIADIYVNGPADASVRAIVGLIVFSAFRWAIGWSISRPVGARRTPAPAPAPADVTDTE